MLLWVRLHFWKLSYRKSLAALLWTTFLDSLSIVSSHALTYNIAPIYTNVRFAIDHFNNSTNTDSFYNSEEIQ